jgi:hypothetical protein
MVSARLSWKVELYEHYECLIENSCGTSETNGGCDGNTRTMRRTFPVSTTSSLHLRLIRLWVLHAALILMAAFVPCCVFGQSESAAVSGRVTDQQNAVIPNVEVEIRNVDTNSAQVTKTNGDSIYSFPSLRPGNYVMSVQKNSSRQCPSRVSRCTYKTLCHGISPFRLDHPQCRSLSRRTASI